MFKIIHHKPVKAPVFLRTMEWAWKVVPDDVEFGCMKANLFVVKFHHHIDLERVLLERLFWRQSCLDWGMDTTTDGLRHNIWKNSLLDSTLQFTKETFSRWDYKKAGWKTWWNHESQTLATSQRVWTILPSLSEIGYFITHKTLSIGSEGRQRRYTNCCEIWTIIHLLSFLWSIRAWG